MSNIECKNDEVIIFKKKLITKRKVAWYASKSFDYPSLKISLPALPWTSELIDLKNRVEVISG